MSKVSFGTGGFRAIIGEDFTKENVQLISQAVCNIAERKNYKKNICIGYDYRFESEIFAKWCAEVFAGNGFKVELFDSAVTTPVVMYASLKNKNNFGMMITASHNPYNYNGVKIFVADGKDACKEETDEIEKEVDIIKKINSKNFADCKKEIKLVSYINDYLNSIIKNQGIKPINSNLNVVFDAKFGSSIEELNLFCKKIKLNNFTIINGYRDAFFNFTLPAPNENNIEKLREAVLINNANIGFALDADGDRLAVIDEKGNYIDNNVILAVIYYYLIKYCGKSGGLVKNCCTSTLCDVVANNLNEKIYETPVGFKYISSKLIETKSVLGGESSGGLAVENHIWGKDSILAIALCIKIIEETKKTFSEFVQEVLHFADDFNKKTYDKSYSYTQNQKDYILNAVFNSSDYPINSSMVKSIIKDDYLKINFKNNDWINIRFSGTEPILRIFVECDSKEIANNYFEDWEKYLKL